MRFSEYASALTRRWSRRGAALVVHRSLPSTHLLARRIADEYSGECLRAPDSDFLAWEQTAGQGREGRPWSSPGGAGVYATLVRALAPALLQTLPLLVAVALCETLNARMACRCRLKWPNDLLVDGRKLGGILIDAVSREGEEDAVAVISFGVNHRRGVDVPGATSLERETSEAWDLLELTEELVRAVDHALGRGEAAAEIIDRYRRLSLHQPGERLRCLTGGGEVEGVFQGFDRHGFLRLLIGGEERLLMAGEVRNGV